MLTALILVCSLAGAKDADAAWTMMRNCDRNNATYVLQVPEQFQLPVMCQMRGQAYLAQTSIGQELDPEKEQVKVLCIKSVNPQKANEG